MSRKLSTSGADVLQWFTGNSSWSMKDAPIYESRALTDMVCQRLARDGYLEASYTENVTVYTLNPTEMHRVDELLRSR